MHNSQIMVFLCCLTLEFGCCSSLLWENGSCLIGFDGHNSRGASKQQLFKKTPNVVETIEPHAFHFVLWICSCFPYHSLKLLSSVMLGWKLEFLKWHRLFVTLVFPQR